MWKTICLIIIAAYVCSANDDICEECKETIAMLCKEAKEDCSLREDLMKMVIIGICRSDKKCAQMIRDISYPDMRIDGHCQAMFLCSRVTSLEFCQMGGACPSSNILDFIFPEFMSQGQSINEPSPKTWLNSILPNRNVFCVFNYGLCVHRKLKVNQLDKFARSEGCDDCKREIKEAKMVYSRTVEVDLPQMKEIYEEMCNRVPAKKELCKTTYEELVANLQHLFTKALDILTKQSPTDICTTMKMCP